MMECTPGSLTSAFSRALASSGDLQKQHTLAPETDKYRPFPLRILNYKYVASFSEASHTLVLYMLKEL